MGCTCLGILAFWFGCEQELEHSEVVAWLRRKFWKLSSFSLLFAGRSPEKDTLTADFFELPLNIITNTTLPSDIIALCHTPLIQ